MKQIVYILYSKKLDRYYTGATSDIETRLIFHQNSPAHKFTAKAKDWVLYLKIECNTKDQALAIEKHIKRMKSKVYIQNLKKYPEITTKLKLKYSN